MKLGSKIAAIRRNLGETQEEFARRFGKATSTVGGWEADLKTPRHKDLAQIAKLGQTTVDDLLGVSENYQVLLDDIPVDSETKKVLSDLTKRIVEAEGEEKKMLLNMLRAIINTK